MINRPPQPELITPAASPEETAAIVAALERFRRATTPAAESGATGQEEWLRTAILEGASRHMNGEIPDPWINT
jgi:hypothetical protein